MHISHKDQKEVWEKEHQNPTVFTHLAGREASGGVKRFWKRYCILNNESVKSPIGLEIGCGKGRNVIWLAKQGAHVTGFDFSSSAIKNAQSYIGKMLKNQVFFVKHDAITSWPFNSNHFNFVIDCFVSTDIEGVKNRSFVSKEIFRVLKPGGYLFLYTNSINSELYKEMLFDKHIIRERNAFYYPEMGKFEKVYDLKELDDLYKNFRLIDAKIYKRYSKVYNQN